MSNTQTLQPTCTPRVKYKADVRHINSKHWQHDYDTTGTILGASTLRDVNGLADRIDVGLLEACALHVDADCAGLPELQRIHTTLESEV